MDDIDINLISALRENARMSISDLSIRINVSRATIRTRLNTLIESGQISGFTIQTKADLHDNLIRAITLIAIEGKSSDHVISRLRGMTEVTAIHTTNGKWDIIAEIATIDLSTFDEVLRRIRLFEGISQTETNILLATRKHKISRIR